jgi:hypothetical protein
MEVYHRDHKAQRKGKAPIEAIEVVERVLTDVDGGEPMVIVIHSEVVVALERSRSDRLRVHAKDNLPRSVSARQNQWRDNRGRESVTLKMCPNERIEDLSQRTSVTEW